MSESGMLDVDEAALQAQAAELRARVAAAAERSGRQAADVRIVAVTKTVPIERIMAAARLGFTRCGENRVQEARDKQRQITALAEEAGGESLPVITWELIGHLQTNKVPLALDLFARVQSVDSLRLAQALDARLAQVNDATLPVLLEVNIGQEASKSGFAPDEVIAAAQAILQLPHLHAEGLMTVAPITEEMEQARPYFRALRELRDRLRDVTGQPWPQLSMGMTDDFEVAIEEGATLIRIGRGLFGGRPPKV